MTTNPKNINQSINSIEMRLLDKNKRIKEKKMIKMHNEMKREETKAAER